MSSDTAMTPIECTGIGRLFVVSAPAGTGKTTLVGMLVQEFQEVQESISCTTRRPRSMEVAGEHYHFLDHSEFARRQKEGEFLESAEIYGDSYGTSQVLLEQQRKGHHVVLTIDTQGATQVRERYEDAVLIFITPPSFEVLRQRLEGRKTESAEVIAQRVAWAEYELQQVHHYDYHVINDTLDHAYAILRSILIAETHKINKNKNQ